MILPRSIFGLTFEVSPSKSCEQLERFRIRIHHTMIEHLLVDFMSSKLPFIWLMRCLRKCLLLRLVRSSWRRFSDCADGYMGRAFGGRWSFELKLHDNFLNY
jgi:hypothetical protein